MISISHTNQPNRIVRLIPVRETQQSQAGITSTLSKQEAAEFYQQHPDAGKDHISPLEVGKQMLTNFKHCDELEGQDPSLLEMADIRDEDKCQIGIWYPAHGVLRVETMETARRVERDINEWLHKHRGAYPAEMGYHACVSTGAYSTYGNIGDEKHPWRMAAARYPNGCTSAEFRLLHTKDASGQPDWLKSPVRLLIVVDLCRECISNRFAVREGLAQHCASIALSVQARGRSDRSVIKPNEDGTISVPPIELDSPVVFLHPAFNTPSNLNAIYSSYAYMMQPDEYIGEMPTLASLVDGQAPEDMISDEVKGLNHHDKVRIAKLLGDDMEEDGTEWPVQEAQDEQSQELREQLNERALVAIQQVADERIQEILNSNDPQDVKAEKVVDIEKSAEKLGERVTERTAQRVLRREGRAEPAPPRVLQPPTVTVYQKPEVTEKGRELLGLLKTECAGQTTLIDQLDKMIAGQIEYNPLIETLARESVQNARDESNSHQIDMTSEDERARQWKLKRDALFVGVVNNLRPGGYDKTLGNTRFRGGYGVLGNWRTGRVYGVVGTKINEVVALCFGRQISIQDRVLPTEHELARFDFPDIVPALIRHVTAQIFAEYAPDIKRGLGL